MHDFRKDVMASDMENEYGNIKVNDDVIAVCAAKAALETEGVASLASGITTAITGNILGKSPDARGVKVNISDDRISIDLFVIAEYGVKIPSMAWTLQENIKKELENLTGMAVDSINVHIQGIHYEK